MGVYEEISHNKRNSVFLIVLFFIIISAIGALIGYFFDAWIPGLVIAASLAVIFTLISYYTGDQTILSISKAKLAKKEDYPHYVNTAEGLAIAAGIPTPKLYVIESPAINALATGRDPKHSAIAVTTGALEKLNRAELEGVVAHEMSHIKNYDIKFMTLVVALVGFIIMLSHIIFRMTLYSGGRNRSSRDGGGMEIVILLIGLALVILSPILAQIIKFAISRKREFLADASGALLTRHPPGLASALEKIKNDHNKLESANNATVNLFISNPFKKASFSSLFSTHPNIDKRIKRLKAM